MTQTTIDVLSTSAPGALTINGQAFPPAYICQNPRATQAESAAWVAEHRGRLLQQAAEQGAVLFRGFPLASPEDFDAFIAAFDLPNFPYDRSLSNAVRVNWTERVFSANEAPADVTIFLHHEMAQTPVFPEKLFFFCQKAADDGGATPLCRSDALMDKLAQECPQFVRDCEQYGLQYTNVMPSQNDAQSGMGRSWQSTLASTSREEAERRLLDLGYSWQWLDDGCLQATTPVLPAIRTLPDGRKAFFNQLIAAYCGWKDTRNDPSKAIRFGNGQPLDRSAVDRAIALAESCTFDLMWQAGDVALVDNCVAMHGRRTFSGTRKVLASLVSPQSHAFEPKGAA